MRRTKGATTMTVGKVMAKNVATPDIQSDMKQDRSKLKAICSSLLGMNGRITGLANELNLAL